MIKYIRAFPKSDQRITGKLNAIWTPDKWQDYGQLSNCAGVFRVPCAIVESIKTGNKPGPQKAPSNLPTYRRRRDSLYCPKCALWVKWTQLNLHRIDGNGCHFTQCPNTELGKARASATHQAQKPALQGLPDRRGSRGDGRGGKEGRRAHCRPRLTALRWDQLDLKVGRLHVARLKHGDPSTHPLRGPELRAIRAWKRRQADTSPYVFTSLRGGPMTRRTVHYVVAQAAKAAGIHLQVHPHMLRHSTGFYLANAGQDTRAIQLYLGHKNIQHTVRYTQLAADRFRDFWKD